MKSSSQQCDFFFCIKKKFFLLVQEFTIIIQSIFKEPLKILLIKPFSSCPSVRTKTYTKIRTPKDPFPFKLLNLMEKFRVELVFNAELSNPLETFEEPFYS